MTHGSGSPAWIRCRSRLRISLSTSTGRTGKGKGLPLSHARPIPKQRPARRVGCQDSWVPSSARTQQRVLRISGRAGLRFHLGGRCSLGTTGPGAPSPSPPIPKHPSEGLAVTPLPLGDVAQPVTRRTVHPRSREVPPDSPPSPGQPPPLGYPAEPRPPPAPISVPLHEFRAGVGGAKQRQSPRSRPPLPGESSRGRGAAGPAGPRSFSFTP